MDPLSRGALSLVRALAVVTRSSLGAFQARGGKAMVQVSVWMAPITIEMASSTVTTRSVALLLIASLPLPQRQRHRQRLRNLDSG
jgi:hypothetical protein